MTYRTNNISETYKKLINKQISKSNPSIFSLIVVPKNEETLRAVDYEKANLGKV